MIRYAIRGLSTPANDPAISNSITREDFVYVVDAGLTGPKPKTVLEYDDQDVFTGSLAYWLNL